MFLFYNLLICKLTMRLVWPILCLLASVEILFPLTLLALTSRGKGVTSVFHISNNTSTPSSFAVTTNSILFCKIRSYKCWGSTISGCFRLYVISWTSIDISIVSGYICDLLTFKTCASLYETIVAIAAISVDEPKAEAEDIGNTASIDLLTDLFCVIEKVFLTRNHIRDLQVVWRGNSASSENNA